MKTSFSKVNPGHILLLLFVCGILLSVAFYIPITFSIDNSDIEKDSSGAYRAAVGYGGDNFESHSSRLVLLENGDPLGPAHSPHSEIANIGMGRYSFWKGTIWFSSSDNSDPRTNGRKYTYVVTLYELLNIFPLVFLVLPVGYLLFRGSVAKAIFEKWGHPVSVFIIWLCALSMLGVIAGTYYLLPRGVFENDTGLMYCTYEHPEFNQLLTAVPIFLSYVGLNSLTVVEFRYIRFFTGLTLGALAYWSFFNWRRHIFGQQYGALQNIATLLIFLVGTLQYPLQIVAWPFGHHDILLWSTLLLTILLFNGWRFITWRPLAIFVWGVLSGFLFFVKPTTLFFYLLALAIAIFFLKTKYVDKIMSFVLFTLGVVSFAVLYFILIQPFNQWREMIDTGLLRMDTLASSLDKDTLSTSLFVQLKAYFLELLNIIIVPLVNIATSPIAAGCFVITFILFRCYFKSKFNRIWLYSTVVSLYFSVFVWCLVSSANVIFKILNIIIYSMDVVFLHGLICAFFTQSVNYLYKGNVDRIRNCVITYSLLTLFILSAHSGSNQRLSIYAAEYFFIPVLWTAISNASYNMVFPKYKDTAYVVLMLPLFIIAGRDHAYQVFKLYGGINNIANYNSTLAYTKRTSKLLVDQEMYNEISVLHNLLDKSTDFQSGDLFFEYEYLTHYVYLLGGVTLLCDSSYHSNHVLSSYYYDAVKKYHGQAIRDAFVLLSSDDTTLVSILFVKFGIQFDRHFSLLGSYISKDSAFYLEPLTKPSQSPENV